MAPDLRSPLGMVAGLAAGIALLVAAGCSRGADATRPRDDVSGTWTAHTISRGEVQLSLSETASGMISGSGTVEGITHRINGVRPLIDGLSSRSVNIELQLFPTGGTAFKYYGLHTGGGPMHGHFEGGGFTADMGVTFTRVLPR